MFNKPGTLTVTFSTAVLLTQSLHVAVMVWTPEICVALNLNRTSPFASVVPLAGASAAFGRGGLSWSCPPELAVASVVNCTARPALGVVPSTTLATNSAVELPPVPTGRSSLDEGDETVRERLLLCSTGVTQKVPALPRNGPSGPNVHLAQPPPPPEA